MRKIIMGLVILALLPFIKTLANTPEVRNHDNFTEIKLSISANIELVQSNNFEVVVEASDKDLKKVVTKVEHGALVITTKPGNVRLGSVKIKIKMPEITTAIISGSGDITAFGKFNCSDLKLEISGSGDMEFEDLHTNNLNASISGSGDIRVKGTCSNDFNIDITGSGDISALNFKCASIMAKIVGSGDAKVHATDYLKTKIVGSGDVSYKGTPRIDANSVGSGSTRSI